MTTHNSETFRVLIADDSPFMRTALTRVVESDPDLQVVGVAVDGKDAVEKVRALQPDVVTLDVEMPRMSGLEALTEIMAASPCPVIMLSSVTRVGARITLDALARGAFDFVAKPGPEAAQGIFEIRDELLAKIKSAVHSPLSRNHMPGRKAPARALPVLSAQFQTPPAILAIGTSTGGPKALQEILTQIPATLPTGILIVQHMPPGFTTQFAERLNRLCQVAVRESKGDEAIEVGNVYIAPAGWHLTVCRAGQDYRTHIGKVPSDTLHTPSVDVLMNSVASVYGNQAMGMILTGMGNDGARGIKAIRDAGGWTVGQDAETCAVYGMPRCAAELNALSRVAPLQQMAAEIRAAFPARTQPAARRASASKAR